MEQFSQDYLNKNEARQVREMLRKHEPMRKGSSGEMNTVKHHIYLSLNARPVVSRPYRERLVKQRNTDKEIRKMSEQEVIDPAQCKWTSPVELASKSDGSWRFFIDDH